MQFHALIEKQCVNVYTVAVKIVLFFKRKITHIADKLLLAADP